MSEFTAKKLKEARVRAGFTQDARIADCTCYAGIFIY